MGGGVQLGGRLRLVGEPPLEHAGGRGARSIPLLAHKLFVSGPPTRVQGDSGTSRLLDTELWGEPVGIEQAEHGVPAQALTRQPRDLAHSSYKCATEQRLLLLERVADLLSPVSQLWVGVLVGLHHR